MKYNSIKLSGFLLAFLLPCLVGAQTTLQGEWTGYCVREMNIEDNVSMISFCDLCSVELSEDKTMLKFDQTKLTFSEGILMINKSGSVSEVPYVYNEENWILTYDLEEESNNYKVLFIDIDRTLLRGTDGCLMLLEKEKGR
jgi:hypothetical protein